MSNLVPDGWSIEPFEQVITKLIDFRGKTPKKLGMEWGGGNIRALSANNVQMGKVNFDKECYLASSELYEKWMTKGDTEKNDVLLTMEAPLGNVALVPDDNKYILSQRVVLLKANIKKIYSQFLYQQLKSDSFQRLLQENATGTTALGIPQKKLVKLDVIVPPLPEQQKIAKILTSVDEVIEKTQAQIDKLKDLKTGMVQELLTFGVKSNGIGHTEFKDSPVGRIPTEWEVAKVSNIANVVDSMHLTPSFTEIGKPMVRVTEIRNSEILDIGSALNVDESTFVSFSRNYQPIIGDTLIARVGAYFGATAYIADSLEFCLGQNTASIRPENVKPEYLFIYLNSEVARAQMDDAVAVGAQPSLSLKAIKELKIALPSEEEQEKISNAISSVSRKIELVKNKLDAIKKSKKALMQDLLTGKVRVKVDS